MTSPTLVVLAAGMGSRYGSLKQIDPVSPAGETIIDYSVYDALRGGFGKLVFVLSKDIEQSFRQIVAARFENYIAIEYVFQELNKLPPPFSVPRGRTKPWGTTHAILAAAAAIHEPFAVINADDFYGAEGYRLLAHHLQSGTADYAMVGFILRNTLSDFGTVSRGVCRVTGDNFLQSIAELKAIEPDAERARNADAAGRVTSLSGDEAVSMNMWGFTPQIFGELQEHFEKFLELHGSELQSESYIPSAINELVSENLVRVRVLRTDDPWFGVTYREDRPHVVTSISNLIQKGHYPERLWP
jgi:UTP-glucose-1-phosphate uridylyltransferase